MSVKGTSGNFLDRMSGFDIVMGLIYLRPKCSSFSDDEINGGVRRATNQFPSLKRVIETSTGSPIPDKSDAIYDSIDSGLRSFFLQYTGDYQFTFMTSAGKKFVEQGLRKNYGDDIFDKLKPVAKAVWTN